MTSEIHPVVGNWYQGADEQAFEVVAVDEDDETIGIQFADGAVEELDMDTWFSMELNVTTPPDDLGGLFDGLDDEELESTSYEDDQWSDFLDDMD
jgi:hypothetical protein